MRAYRLYNEIDGIWAGAEIRYDVTKKEEKSRLWYSLKLAQNAASRKNKVWRGMRPGYRCAWKDHGYEGTWEVIEYELVRVK